MGQIDIKMFGESNKYPKLPLLFIDAFDLIAIQFENYHSTIYLHIRLLYVIISLLSENHSIECVCSTSCIYTCMKFNEDIFGLPEKMRERLERMCVFDELIVNYVFLPDFSCFRFKSDKTR